MDRRKIFVVDDNPTIRKGLSVRLRANGCEVLIAEDAISATATLVTERPDLVVLDLGLPCGDGFVVMERLHKNDRLANIPVIVLTGRELAVNRDRALQAGAVAFYQKPVPILRSPRLIYSNRRRASSLGCHVGTGVYSAAIGRIGGGRWLFGSNMRISLCATSMA
jgi:twitching motility two-component system response regulator PilG